MFTTNNNVDVANGFANFKPSDETVPLNTVNVSVPGFFFHDLFFDTQLFKADTPLNLLIAAFRFGTLLDSY